MKQYNLSVSKICAYDDYTHGRWNQDDDSKLLTYIKGEQVTTFQQSRGTAMHTYIEDREKYKRETIEVSETVPIHHYGEGMYIDFESSRTHFEEGAIVDGVWLSKPILDKADWYVDSVLSRNTHFFEEWVSGSMVVDGIKVFVPARVDVLTVAGLRDIKTSNRSMDFNQFHDSYQWRLYLLNSGMDSFHYDHFQFIERNNEVVDVKYSTMQLNAYPQMEADCRKLISDFLGYIEMRGLEDFVLPKKK